MRALVWLLLASAATPAVAQHAGHTMPPQPAETPATEPSDATTSTEAEAEAEAGSGSLESMDHSVDGVDHSQMDHSQLDHGSTKALDAESVTAMPMDHQTMEMDHSAMGQDAGPIPEGPPPAAAGSGPPRASDAIWGADAMRASRESLRKEQGGQSYFWFQGDRVEYRIREGKDGYLWDVQGYYGGDIDKFWFKSEGEGSFGEEIESAEIQALYSRAIGPWFDLQAGVRQDFTPRDRTYAVVGVQGLAPYLFEVDIAAFLSDKGDLTARLEGELDQRITQRLILQPRAELALSAQDVPELGIGAGLDTVEVGLRLRYEIAREFAPYIGIEQEWKLGQSADYTRLAGEDPSVTNVVVGVRFWF